MQKSQTKAEVDGLLISMSADGEHTLTENYGEALEMVKKALSEEANICRKRNNKKLKRRIKKITKKR